MIKRNSHKNKTSSNKFVKLLIENFTCTPKNPLKSLLKKHLKNHLKNHLKRHRKSMFVKCKFIHTVRHNSPHPTFITETHSHTHKPPNSQLHYTLVAIKLCVLNYQVPKEIYTVIYTLTHIMTTYKVLSNFF